MQEQNEEFAAKRDQERGAVIVLIALLLVVLISFGALAIDGLTAANAQRQMTVVSEMASLAGAEQFFGSQAGTVQGQLTEALTRANQVSALNELVGYAEGPSTSPDQPFGYLGLAFSGGCSGWPAGNDCTNGSLIPGEYFLEDPDGPGPEDPCHSTYPCFEAAADETGTINAFQVVTNVVTPMRTWFGRVTGFDNLALSGDAIAAQVPRHAMFLVDESTSMTGDTHRASNPSCPEIPGTPCYDHFSQGTLNPPGFANYTYDGGQPPSGNPLEKQVAGIRSYYGYEQGGVLPVCNPPYSGDPNTHPVNIMCSWQALGTRPANCTAGAPQADCAWNVTTFEDFTEIKWFQDDYTVNITVNDQCDRGGGVPAGNRDYLFPAHPGQLADPQPLFSVLRGVVAALNEFALNAVAGDLVGIKAFDECVPNDPISDRFFELGPVSNIPVAAVDPDDASDDYLTNMFFPMGNYNTDGVIALEQALTDLAAQPNALLASSFVVIFTDGLFNCHGDPARTCDNQYPDHAAAMAELVNLTDLFASQRVAAHVIYAGDAVNPHTLLYRSLDNPDCMDDLEARYLGIDYVDPSCGGMGCQSDYNNMVAGIGTFSEHIIYMYDLARKTGGEFVTLRDPCVPGTDVSPNLTAACAAAAQWFWTDPPVPTPVYLQPYTRGPGPAPGDNQVLCEPTGVDKDIQVQQAIARIMGIHPFKLVQ